MNIYNNFILDLSNPPKSVSIRLVMITVRFVALFIIPAYSGFLLTYILFQNIEFPFNDIKGLVEDGSYKIGFSVESNIEHWFEVGTKIFQVLKRSQF